jgi:hypothetical protein
MTLENELTVSEECEPHRRGNHEQPRPQPSALPPAAAARSRSRFGAPRVPLKFRRAHPQHVRFVERHGRRGAVGVAEAELGGGGGVEMECAERNGRRRGEAERADVGERCGAVRAGRTCGVAGDRLGEVSHADLFVEG